ncbi:c-type cytochrome [Tropicimonas marinistellae]|uniref:c-type cytochrome n=1 Tax=Tropicimonas marinistellae TaxID=1739787 RepID=UPI0013733AAC|nr:c-type cytochrome [Tropicimonas marinistellae]
MFCTLVAATVATIALSLQSNAQTAEAGAEAFDQQCASCHVVVNGAGQTLAGKRARTGPNLYGVAGAPAARIDGFRYGSGLRAAAEAGLIWDDATFVAFITDTNGFLREFTGDRKARSKMAGKAKSAEDAAAIFAFLKSVQ